jgi:hypothetical protein
VSDHLRTRTKKGFGLHIRRSTILSDREGSDWVLTAFDVLISFPGRRTNLHAKSFRRVPQRDDGSVALPEFEAAHISAIHAQAGRKLSLGQTSGDAQPSHIPPHHPSHVFRHGHNGQGCAI